ncbi:hypothetical protein EHS25_000253 [Saitozyma podzolica]|uniref:Uncharacterized protein n=1 Tax=Saitozyma podzolica TaxID=1890683 RepID=A0A427YVP6_9TREE|nr:hypothetical protein EHS25_000253 [Saitozyma podzolica]
MVNATMYNPSHPHPSSSARHPSLLGTFSTLAQPSCMGEDVDSERDIWSAEGSPVDSEDYGSDGSSSDPSCPSTIVSASSSSNTSPSSIHTTDCPSPSPSSPKMRNSTLPSLSAAHPYRPPSGPRPRPRGLTPMTPLSTVPAPPQHLAGMSLPKSQPLARALFARMANDTPHAGFTGLKKKATSQKVIVPTKQFRTTFELGLTSSELARKA